MAEVDRTALAEAIKRQDELESQLNQMMAKKEEAFSAMYNAIKAIPTTVFEHANVEVKKGFEHFAALYNDKERYQRLTDEMHKAPNYQNVNITVAEYDRLKYEYYKLFYQYINVVLKDREALFDSRYLTNLEKLADKGWFLYFMRTPDFELFDDSDKTIAYITRFFCSDDYAELVKWIRPVLELQTGSESMRDRKIIDLTEAIACLIHGAFRSCARTMIAILENEHRLCSDLLPKSRGIDRAKKIDENIYNLEVEYYYKAWEKMNDYFKTLNADIDKSTDFELNRNEIVHGEYRRNVSAQDCLKLILLFSSFKELTFVVMNKIEIEEELNNDMKLWLLREGKYGTIKSN